MDRTKVRRPVKEDFYDYDDDEAFIQSIEKRYNNTNRPVASVPRAKETETVYCTIDEAYEIAREVCEEMLATLNKQPAQQSFDVNSANALAELIATKLGGVAPVAASGVVQVAVQEEPVYDDPDNPYDEEDNADPFKEEAMRLAGKSSSGASADSWRSALTSLPESQGALDIGAITGL